MGNMQEKQMDEQMRKLIDYTVFRQVIKESGAEDANQVAQQLQKSLAASGTLHSALREMADRKRQVCTRRGTCATGAAFLSNRASAGMQCNRP
jgi:2-oxoglutarate dehydrogenase complex dehydrogenase (E1) component-like enzyme